MSRNYKGAVDIDENNLISYALHADFEKNVYTVVQINAILGTASDPTIYPVEVGIAAFSLKEGIIDTLTLLIDPGISGRPPLGRAFNAKILSDDTGLPLPGSSIFQQCHRDYKTIASQIVTFIDRYMHLQEAEYPKRVLFGMSVDLAEVKGGFNWLANSCEDPDLRARLESLLFVDLSKLFYCIAKRVNKNVKNYIPPMVQFNLPNLAEMQLNKFVLYAYCPEICCAYHREVAMNKLDKCARNYILRRVIIFLAEFVDELRIPKCGGHFISLINMDLEDDWTVQKSGQLSRSEKKCNSRSSAGYGYSQYFNCSF